MRRGWLLLVCVLLVLPQVAATPAVPTTYIRNWWHNTYHDVQYGRICGPNCYLSYDNLGGTGGSAFVVARHGYPAETSHDLDYGCVSGVRVSLAFEVPSSVSFSHPVVIMHLSAPDATGHLQPVASVHLQNSRNVHVNGAGASSFTAEKGYTHALEVEVVGPQMRVSLNGQEVSTSSLRPDIPTKLRMGMIDARDQGKGLYIDEVKVSPILGDVATSFAAPWTTFGATDEAGEGVSVAEPARTGPGSMRIVVDDGAARAADKPQRLGAWDELPMAPCLLPRTVGLTAGGWFHVPEDAPWGNATFSFLQMQDAAPGAAANVTYRIGDVDGDLRLDVEVPSEPWTVVGPPRTGGTVVATGAQLERGAWHHVAAYARPANETVRMEAFGPKGFLSPDVPRVVDVTLDGVRVATVDLPQGWTPRFVLTGSTEAQPGERNAFVVHVDDFAARADVVGTLCAEPTPHFNVTTFTMWMPPYGYAGNLDVVARTLDDGRGAQAPDEWNSVTLSYDGEGDRTYYHNLTLADGRIVSEACPVSLDLTPPVSNFTLGNYHGDPLSVGRDGWILERAYGFLSATDDRSGVATPWIGYNSHGPWTLANGYDDFSTPQRVLHLWNEGIYNVTFYTDDRARNREAAQFEVVKVDFRPPTVTAALSGTRGHASWFSTPVNVSMHAADSMSGLLNATYSYGDAQDVPLPATLDIDAEGWHAIQLHAEDAAGHQTNTASGFGVDLTPPYATNLTLPLQGPSGWATSSLAQIDSADAASGVWRQHLLVNGTLHTLYGDSATHGLPDGVHELVAWAEDLALHRGPNATASVRIDATPPTSAVTFAQPPMGTSPISFRAESIAGTINATDATSGVALVRHRVDGGAWIDGADFVLEGQGEHLLEHYALDVAGNAEPVQGVRVFLDLDPPTFRFDPPGPWYAPGERIHVWAEDGESGADGVCATFAGRSTCGNPVEIKAGSTDTYLAATATDVAGNRRELLTRIRVDDAPPLVDVDRAPVIIPRGEVNITGWADDARGGVASVRVSVGGRSIPVQGLEDWTASFAVYPGAHRLRIEATDALGHVTKRSYDFVVLPVHDAPPVWREGATARPADEERPANLIGGEILALALDRDDHDQPKSYQTRDASTVWNHASWPSGVGARVEGRHGEAYRLGATSTYLRVDDAKTGGLTAGTFAAWVNFTSLERGFGYLIVKADPGRYAELFAAVDTDGSIVFSTGQSSTVVLRSPAGSVEPGRWTHVALTWGPAGKHILIDGEVVAESPDTTRVGSASTTTVIGADPNNLKRTGLKAILDEVRLYDVQLTAAQIRHVAQQAYATA